MVTVIDPDAEDDFSDYTRDDLIAEIVRRGKILHGDPKSSHLSQQPGVLRLLDYYKDRADFIERSVQEWRHQAERLMDQVEALEGQNKLLSDEIERMEMSSAQIPLVGSPTDKEKTNE